jgi:hypothetical protein
MRHQACSKAVGVVVRQPDRFVEISVWHERDDRSESFLWFSRILLAIWCSAATRSEAGILDQLLKAVRAGSTAECASCAAPRAASPMSSSVAGLTISISSVALPEVN